MLGGTAGNDILIASDRRRHALGRRRQRPARGRRRQRHHPRRRRRRHHHRHRRRRQHPGRRRQRRHPRRQRHQPDHRRLRQRLHRHRRGRVRGLRRPGQRLHPRQQGQRTGHGQRGRRLDRERHVRRRARRQFDPLGNDPIIGNDVFIGGGEHRQVQRRRRRRHHGRQRRPGRPLHRRAPASTGRPSRTTRSASTIDMTDRFFDQPPVPGSGASVLARFDVVEGLSGSAYGDILRGDDADAGGDRRRRRHGQRAHQHRPHRGLQDVPRRRSAARDRRSTAATSSSAATAATSSRAAAATTSSTATPGSTCASACAQNADGTGAEIASFDSMEPMIPLMLRRHLQSRPAPDRARDPVPRTDPTSTPPCSPARLPTTPSRSMASSQPPRTWTTLARATSSP